MKIGQFTDTFLPIVDGVGRVCVNYAFGIPKAGHECIVVAPENKDRPNDSYPFDIYEYNSMPMPVTPQYKAGFPVLDPTYISGVDKIGFDIIHSHTPFIAGHEAIRIAKRRKIPLVGSFHSKYYDDFYKITHNDTISSTGVKLILNFYRHCDEVWAVSRHSANVLHEYGYQGDIVIMENGCEIHPRNRDNIDKADREYSLDRDTDVLLYVGQINWKKNILRILESVALLAQKGRKLRLVLAGQGPDRSSIEQKTRELGIEKMCTFTGHILDPDLLDGLYERASIFVFPSMYDTAGLVVHEAASMGTPSVVLKEGAAAEKITDGVNGFLTDDDTLMMTDIIDRALSDKQRLKEIGEKAAETIPVRWDSTIDKAIARYQNLIAEHKPERRKTHTKYRSADKSE